METSHGRITQPEEPEALKMALDQAYAIRADMVVGTDPTVIVWE